MSAAFVLDCSVTMAWCFEAETTAAIRKVRLSLETQTALVPSLWFLEVINALRNAEQDGKTIESRSGEFLQVLRTLDIQVDNNPPEAAFADVLPLSRAHGLTAYDAAYLELAVRRKLPLATLDNELRVAAKKLGVKLLGK